MKVTLTNLGTVSVPVSSADGEGFAAELKPNTPYTIDDSKVLVATVGDNPSFKEDVQEALGKIAALVQRLWQHASAQPTVAGVALVRVRIDNAGRGLRVRQGDDVNRDIEVDTGEQADATAPNYVELRELTGAP